MSKPNMKAEEALRAGGYITICGNAARYRHPEKGLHKMNFKQARRYIDSLEHYACGIKWPFPDLYRKKVDQ